MDFMFKSRSSNNGARGLGGAVPHNGSAQGVETPAAVVLLGIYGIRQQHDTRRSMLEDHCLAKDTINEITTIN
jgi:hypothetical protein